MYIVPKFMNFMYLGVVKLYIIYLLNINKITYCIISLNLFYFICYYNQCFAIVKYLFRYLSDLSGKARMLGTFQDRKPQMSDNISDFMVPN